MQALNIWHTKDGGTKTAPSAPSPPQATEADDAGAAGDVKDGPETAVTAEELGGGAIAGIVIAVVVAALAVGCVLLLIVRERQGKPIFVTLPAETTGQNTDTPNLEMGGKKTDSV